MGGLALGGPVGSLISSAVPSVLQLLLGNAAQNDAPRRQLELLRGMINEMPAQQGVLNAMNPSVSKPFFLMKNGQMSQQAPAMLPGDWYAMKASGDPRAFYQKHMADITAGADTKVPEPKTQKKGLFGLGFLGL